MTRAAKIAAALQTAALLTLTPAPADAKSDWPCAACRLVR